MIVGTLVRVEARTVRCQSDGHDLACGGALVCRHIRALLLACASHHGAFPANSSVCQALFARQGILHHHLTAAGSRAAFHILSSAGCGGFRHARCCASLRLLGRVLDANAGDLVIELTAFGQVTMLVIVSLVLEILAVILVHVLPGPADLLHHFKGAHVGVRCHDFRSRFLDEDHVGREALLRLLDRRALALQLLELALISFLV